MVRLPLVKGTLFSLLATFVVWGGACLAADSAVFTLDLRQILSESSGTKGCRLSSSGVFCLDLRGVEGVATGVAGSGPVQAATGRFTIDLRELTMSSGGAFAQGASSATFVLDLRNVGESSGDDSGGENPPTGSPEGQTETFTLDLRQLDNPLFVHASSATFTLDLRQVAASDASSDGIMVCDTTGGFVLDLRAITDVEVSKDVITGKIGDEPDEPEDPEPTFDVPAMPEIVWKDAGSAVFTLDLRDVGEMTAGVPLASASSAKFTLDLRNLQMIASGDRVVFLASETFVLDLRRITAEGVIILPEDVTGDKALEVPEEWLNTKLDERFGAGTSEKFGEKFGYDLKTALTKPTGKRDARGNPLQVWHDYIAGTDPTDEKSVFKALVKMEDGQPVITWDPALNGEGVQEGVRTYRVFGAKLLGGDWTEVPSGETEGYNFFKVTVEMP